MGRCCMVLCTLPGVSTETSIKRVVRTNCSMFEKSLLSLWKVKQKTLRTKSITWELLKEIYEFEDDQVKPHCATGTQWIAYELEALCNMLEKYGLYMYHFENIIVDTSK